MNKSGNERLIGNSFLSRFSLAMTGYENGTLGCEITPGLRLLAWPFWAAAPLVQARGAPPFYPLVPSSFRP
jgi:hypothetical protein